MKTSFFSWSAVGMVLAAWCFLSACKKEVVQESTPPPPLSLEFALLSPSKVNLLGYTAGLINPKQVKFVSADSIIYHSSYFFTNPPQDRLDEYPDYGLFFQLYLDKNRMFDVYSNHSNNYDFAFYMDLPDGDRDTIVYSNQNGVLNVYFNKVKTEIGRNSTYYFFKKKD